MTVVRGTVLHPADDEPVKGATVRISLLANAAGVGIGFVPTAQTEILHHNVVHADINGNWSVDLTPNVSIVPAGTVYLVEYPAFRESYPILVPDEPTELWVGQLLTVAPGDLPTPLSAGSVIYDPATSHLTATNLQDAVDELAASGGLPTLGANGTVLRVTAGTAAFGSLDGGNA